ncbi:MAG: hypothetical protein FWE60_00520 [Oscillospiraceae bacterium]|nr:hypothetical protein [Oscillospiraceae bacterium]
MKNKYIRLYTAFVILFFAGIPTIAVTIASVGYFTGVTAYLLTELIKSFRLRVLFYVLSLSSAAAYLVISVIGAAYAADLMNLFSALSGIIMSGVILLGLMTAFVIRFVLWRRTRKYEKGEITGVNR